jgi:hypothetical protein
MAKEVCPSALTRGSVPKSTEADPRLTEKTGFRYHRAWSQPGAVSSEQSRDGDLPSSQGRVYLHNHRMRDSIEEYRSQIQD